MKLKTLLKHIKPYKPERYVSPFLKELIKSIRIKGIPKIPKKRPKAKKPKRKKLVPETKRKEILSKVKYLRRRAKGLEKRAKKAAVKLPEAKGLKGKIKVRVKRIKELEKEIEKLKKGKITKKKWKKLNETIDKLSKTLRDIAKKIKDLEEKIAPKKIEIKKPKVELKKINEWFPLIQIKGKNFAWANIRWSPEEGSLVYYLLEPPLSPEDQKQIEKIKDLLEEKLDIDFSALRKMEAREYVKEKLMTAIDELGLDLSQRRIDVIKYYIMRDFVGLNEIEPLFQDPEIEDISCLPHFEDVFVKIDEEPRLTKIGKVVEEELKLSDKKTKIKNSVWSEPTRKIEVLSFNPITLKVDYVPVSRVMKRENTKKYMLRVKTEAGNVMHVSPDHPVILVTEDGLMTKRAERVKVGDHVIVAKKIRGKPLEKEQIDLLEEFRKLGMNEVRVKGVRDLLCKRDLDELAKELGVKKYRISNWRQGNAVPLKVYLKLEESKSLRSSLKLGLQGCKNWIPAIVPLNKKFGRLLGFYLAEGYYHVCGICFSFSKEERELCLEVEGLIRDLFGTYTSINETETSLVVYAGGKLLLSLFRDILNAGGNSYEKKVPDFVYGREEKFTKELLDSYLIGDGYPRTEPENFRVNFPTASHDLAMGMRYLLLSQGINTRTRRRAKRFANTSVTYSQRGNNIISSFEKYGIPHPESQISPCLVERYPAFLFNPVNFSSNRRRHVHDQIRKGERLSEKYAMEEGLVKKFLNGDIHPLQVTNIQKIPYAGDYYDFEVNTDKKPYKNFMHGSFIFTHNCDGTDMPIYIVHRNPTYGELKTNVVYHDPERLSSFVMKLAQRCGKSISVADPLLDGSLPDGSRIQATLGTDIARRGSNFTIRKFTKKPMSPIDIKNYKTLNTEMLAYFWTMIENQKSFLISGTVATGKTTLLNSLGMFIKPELKIISIEESVGGNTDFLYLNDEVLHSGKIGEYIDNAMKAGFEQLDSGYQISMHPNLKVPVLDQNGKVRFEYPMALIRHKTDKDMYLVKTTSGREIEVTGDHSLYSLGPDPKKMDEDKFLHSLLREKLGRCYFDPGQEVNLLEHLRKFKNEVMVVGETGKIRRWIERNEDEIKNIASSIYKNPAKMVRLWKKGDRIPAKVLDKLPIKFIPKNVRIRGVNGNSIPALIEIDPDLSFLIGYLLVRSSVSNEHVVYPKGDRKFIRVLKRLSEKLGLEFGEGRILSRIFYHFLTDVLEMNFEEERVEKRAPAWLMNLSKKNKTAFVEGFIRGNKNPVCYLEPKFVPVEVRKLKPGDKIIGLKKLNYNGEERNLNVLEHLSEFKNPKKLFLDGEEIKTRLKEKRNKLKKVMEESGYSRSTFNRWLREGVISLNIAKKVLDVKNLQRAKIKGRYNSIPSYLPLDDLTLEFLGLWMADGCFDHNNKFIIMSSPQKENEDIVMRFANRFGCGIGRSSDGFSLHLYNVVLYYLMRDILKLRHGSKEKYIPKWMFSLNNEQIAAFLRGYFAGDNDDNKYELGAHSESKKLLKDIQRLLLRFGILARLGKRGDRIRISSIKEIKKFKSIGFIRKDRERHFKKIISRKPPDHDCSDVFNLPRSFLWKILNESKNLVGERWSYAGWTNLKRRYRRSLPGRKFLNSILNEGNVSVGNKDVLKKIVNGDFICDEIKEIKKLDRGERWVYDFSVPPYERFFASGLLCSNTPELRFVHENWIPQVTRMGYGPPGPGGKRYGEVTMYELLKSSLRQRPDYLIVGEVRGREASVMFQALSTGHPGLSTLHADILEKVIDRLTTRPISLPPSLLDNLDVIVFLVRVKRGEKYIRRVKAVLEVVDYDTKKEKLITNSLFKWDPKRDSFDKVGESVMLKRISEDKGIPLEELKKELEVKKRVLDWMVANDISDYRKVTKLINQYYKDPESVLREIR